MTIPLYFQFRTPVYGQGFVADVRIRGRITCMEEYGATCIYGVNPGGLAAGGEDMHSAYLDFRAGLVGTLFDLATDAESFGDFERLAHNFIQTTDDESVAEWQEARDSIRAGTTPVEGTKLRLETAALAGELSMERLPPSTALPPAHEEPEIAATSTLTLAA